MPTAPTVVDGPRNVFANTHSRDILGRTALGGTVGGVLGTAVGLVRPAAVVNSFRALRGNALRGAQWSVRDEVSRSLGQAFASLRNDAGVMPPGDPLPFSYGNSSLQTVDSAFMDMGLAEFEEASALLL